MNVWLLLGLHSKLLKSNKGRGNTLKNRHALYKQATTKSSLQSAGRFLADDKAKMRATAAIASVAVARGAK